MYEQHSHCEQTANLVPFLASTTKLKPSWNKQKNPQWRANPTKHLHLFMGIINVSALLNLPKGYLTSFCSTVAAKSLITVTQGTQSALTQGWWAHNWDQKLTQNLPRNKKLFCAGGGSAGRVGGEERIYDIYPWKGEDHCEVFPVFIIASQQSARGNEQLLWQDREALNGRCQAGVLHSSRKDQFTMETTLSLHGWGLGKSWREEDRWRADEFMQQWMEELKILTQDFRGSNKQTKQHPIVPGSAERECQWAICELLHHLCTSPELGCAVSWSWAKQQTHCCVSASGHLLFPSQISWGNLTAISF